MVWGGKEVSSLDDLASDTEWVALCKAALESGLQPIPEVKIGEAVAASWKEDDVDALVQRLIFLSEHELVSVLLTVTCDAEGSDSEVPLPKVPKALGKKIPIIGSVRVPAKDDRIADETARFKEAGFTGALLRSDCLPGYRINPNLDFVGKFWSACIGDLKSTRSKAFGFRAKNNMEKKVATQWANLQKDVIDSGALGDPSDARTENLKEGEYRGF